MTVVPDEALKQHIAIVGKTGSGKTYTAKGLVEGMLQTGRRVCVIDPTGVWWGLRSSADGESEGFPVVVLGGDEGDLEIADHSGEAAAKAIAHSNLPAVIDLSLFTMGERRRFLEGFLKTLHKENRQPLQLILDEADEMAPQQPLPEMRRVLHEVDRIVRRGRVRGFRVTLITQRPAVLHKNVLTQANSLIAMRVTGPQDRKAIDEWIKGNADAEEGARVLKSLARLKQGEGWVWSPSDGVLEKTVFPEITTFDSGRTPDDDEVIESPEGRANVDLSALQEALSANAEEVVSAPATRLTEEERLEVARKHADIGYQRGVEDTNKRWKGWAKFLIAGINDKIAEECDIVEALSPPLTTEKRPVTKPPINGPNPLVAAAEAIWPVRLTWGALCATQGRKARGGHFNTQRKQALEGGLLVEDGGLVTLTNPPAVDGRDPIELLEEHLPGSARDMFIEIRKNPARSWEEVTARLGRKARGGHFNTGRKVLLDNNLVSTNAGIIEIHPSLKTGAQNT